MLLSDLVSLWSEGEGEGDGKDREEVVEEEGEEAFFAGGMTKYPVDRFSSTGRCRRECASALVRGR